MSKLALGQRIGDAKVVEFCEEPDNGLAIVHDRGWGFKIPIHILARAAAVDRIQRVLVEHIDGVDLCFLCSTEVQPPSDDDNVCPACAVLDIIHEATT